MGGTRTIFARSLLTMAGSGARLLKSRNEKSEGNINRKGNVPSGSASRKREGMSVGPVMITFFLIVVVGSSLVQIIRTAQTGGQSDMWAQRLERRNACMGY